MLTLYLKMHHGQYHNGASPNDCPLPLIEELKVFISKAGRVDETQVLTSELTTTGGEDNYKRKKKY